MNDTQINRIETKLDGIVNNVSDVRERLGRVEERVSSLPSVREMHAVVDERVEQCEKVHADRAENYAPNVAPASHPSVLANGNRKYLAASGGIGAALAAAAAYLAQFLAQ